MGFPWNEPAAVVAVAFAVAVSDVDEDAVVVVVGVVDVVVNDAGC